ncbi:4'-phosphopantetheinyl transferase family protein [Marichromatium bheemlicum]|uniref:4'-phosphopantetheinyl transferase superfamily protein n=1 Tax=Marichromatium bheemlicum TaxID=365339 RepID=A0ABX1I7P7_9GAMM|nr:4'-phosphopantetheinyl transferase superfamily protein [Marichromatium bheemlicum]NKN33288.1 4'-phosphopantetheinyl transferase superfamily protein [Marichromatium bheemlicum]
MEDAWVLGGDWRECPWSGVEAMLAGGLERPLVVMAPLASNGEALAPWLSAPEQARCVRYRRSADRLRCASAHALKRRVLAALLGVRPRALALVQGAYGKPALANGALAFNLSHAGDWVALACDPAGAVGVDLEQPAARHRGIEGITIGHPADRLEPLPVSVEQGFYVTWTLKEAVTKGVGLGLGVEFATLALRPQGDGRYRCRCRGQCWYARHQCLDGGVHLALACRRCWTRVDWWRLSWGAAQFAPVLPR